MAAPYALLTDSAPLDSAFQTSHQRLVMLFKHSLTCPISTTGLQEFERYLGSKAVRVGLVPYLIEIQNHRDLSNAVADRTGVRHESPQALLLKDGKVAWHGSHWDITAQALETAANKS